VLTRRGALIGIGAVAGALALGAGVMYRRSRDAPAGTGPDASTLLALALPDPSGKEVALAQWRGRVLFVNFWATWCAPCREEMPEFIRAQAEFGARGLQFVGIGIDEAAKIEQFATGIGLNYPALVGGYGAMELSRTLGNSVMALPFTVVVGRDGTIAHTQLGPLKPDKMRSIIGKLI
jgi:thiol-disulfide isomerase/thioredoxin